MILKGLNRSTKRKHVFQCHFACLKSHLDWSEIEPWPQVPGKSVGLYCPVQYCIYIRKKKLWRITNQKSIENQIKRRKWNWIRHTLRKETGATEKPALDLNRQGYRRRGRPKRPWRRAIEDEIRSTRRS